MITLYVVRHGETNYNVQDRYLGKADLALNSIGIHQTEELAEKIKNIPIDVVVSSPLKRTLQMAYIILPQQEIVKDDHFIERSLGVYEGLTKQEAKIKYPDLYQKVVTRIFDDAPPQGETIKQVQDRVFNGLDDLKLRYPDKNILLVTHAFIAKVINKYFHPDLSEKDFFTFVLPLIGVKKFVLN